MFGLGLAIPQLALNSVRTSTTVPVQEARFFGSRVQSWSDRTPVFGKES